MNTQYKGFDITLTASDRWIATITRVATGKSFSRRPETPLEDGIEAAFARARNIVDAFLALNGR
jgi:spermidine/putrescine-binding protein